MSAAIVPHPSALALHCDLCIGSPINAAACNVGLELEGKSRFRTRKARTEIHACRECLARLFRPFVPALARLDLEVKVEPVCGVFVVLPLRRLQRKRR